MNSNCLAMRDPVPAREVLNKGRGSLVNPPLQREAPHRSLHFQDLISASLSKYSVQIPSTPLNGACRWALAINPEQ